MKHVYNDGGRAAAGYKGSAGDCVCRAIAITTGKPYQEVYEALSQGQFSQRKSKRTGKQAKTAARGIHVGRKWFKDCMASLGFEWIPTMLVGQGCKVHLNENELPSVRLVVSVSNHYTAVIDGVIHDTYNPSERSATIYSEGYPKHLLPKRAYQMDNGSYCYNPERCVYGYYKLLK